ncbi:DUF1811 family protein [Paenibacillus sp. YYML68]|uniref:DUF1811 family protein n=1 Tax=Paenibacillus sp. YYML68 TaxID=2909250 RepID=UPI0024922F34|nr:DUF1811 family protein [Paenibacillus sp. YYML68]
MKKLFSQMNKEELQHEINSITSEIEASEFESQQAVARQRLAIAQSYMLDPNDFPPGLYKVDHVQLPFEVKYINGIMAWGTLGDDPEASFPLSKLTRL